MVGQGRSLKLYVKDFDRNGSIEQVMCYTVEGKEYTFLAKDELERALPVLKKGYLTYGEVAGKTVQYMFDDLFTDYIELKAETLSSSCFLGDGKGGFKQVELPGDCNWHQCLLLHRLITMLLSVQVISMEFFPMKVVMMLCCQQFSDIISRALLPAQGYRS